MKRQSNWRWQLYFMPRATKLPAQTTNNYYKYLKQYKKKGDTTMIQTKTNKPIFSAAVAGKLIDRGFPIVDCCRNYKDPTKWVYYFEVTPALLKAFDEIATAYSAEHQ